MAARVLERRDAVLPGMLAAVRERRDAVTRWMEGTDHFEWHPPQAGVVCFPRLKPERGADPDVFHTAALRDHGTYVGPGHWFEQDRRCFRLGFGWPGMDELLRGLDGLTAAARDAERAAAQAAAAPGPRRRAARSRCGARAASPAARASAKTTSSPSGAATRKISPIAVP